MMGQDHVYLMDLCIGQTGVLCPDGAGQIVWTDYEGRIVFLFFPELLLIHLCHTFGVADQTLS
jgi:hypothetical protein